MQLAYKRTRKKIDARKEAQTQDRIRLGFERSLSRKMINYFSSLSIGASKALEQTGTMGFDIYMAETRPKVAKILETHWYDVIKTFSDRSEAYILRKELYNGFYQELLEKFTMRVGANHISDIDDTSRKQLRRVLLNGQKDGLPLPQISKNIRERYSPKFSRGRAATIARTETHSAASFANHQVGMQFAKTQPAMQKQWIATNDVRTREAHRIANGQIVNIDSPFIVGGRPMEYTGDPNGGAANIINCRCAVIYIEPQDDVFDSQRNNVVQPVNLTDITESSIARPLSINTLLAPAINSSLRGDTLKISSTREIKKQLDERTKKVKPEYEDINLGILNTSGFDYEYGSRFRGTPFKNDLKNLDDVTATAVFEILKELDDLAVRFKIPKLNSIQPVIRVKGKDIIASMGDGRLRVESKFFNKYSKGIKGRNLAITQADEIKIAKLTKEIDDLDLEYTALRNNEGAKFNQFRDTLGLPPLKETLSFVQYKEFVDRHNSLARKVNSKRKAKDKIKGKYGLIEYRKDTWKRGEDINYRAGNGLNYFDDGLDRIRNNMYHEFGHHVHQITKVSNVENYGIPAYGGLTDLERKLRSINKKNIKEGGPSIYSGDDSQEWFAENFALYFQDRKDLTDPVFNQFIQDIMEEANGL